MSSVPVEIPFLILIAVFTSSVSSEGRMERSSILKYLILAALLADAFFNDKPAISLIFLTFRLASITPLSSSTVDEFIALMYCLEFFLNIQMSDGFHLSFLLPIFAPALLAKLTALDSNALDIVDPLCTTKVLPSLNSFIIASTDDAVEPNHSAVL